MRKIVALSIMLMLAISLVSSCKKKDKTTGSEIPEELSTTYAKYAKKGEPITAQSLYSTGYTCYTTNKFEDAELLFRHSLDYDDKNENTYYYLIKSAVKASITYHKCSVDHTQRIAI